jgi:hypothetical protein
MVLILNTDHVFLGPLYCLLSNISQHITIRMSFILNLSGDEMNPTFENSLSTVACVEGTTTATAYVSLEALRKVFSDHIISRGLWPPHSPDLVPCDFYMWGSLKNKIH